MQRSKINNIILEADAFIRRLGYALPPFADWPPERIRSPQATIIRDRGLGWDITDFGSNKFEEIGLFLFAVRNGLLSDLNKGLGMLYAEKIMISRKDQVTPMHRHNLKAEDIINRGCGDLVIQLFASGPQGQINRSATVSVNVDGVKQTLPAGGKLLLKTGSSVTLLPYVWHSFWAERADCMIGEVSTINNDNTDNIFDIPRARFATIDEDTKPKRLLVSDY